MNKYFDDFAFQYDINDKEINYKYYHSYRVMNNMELLSKKLNLSSKDIHLAKVIGLLHDIGRFEQDKMNNSFIDKKFDHGNYGVYILKATNLLDNFNIDKEDYEVVYKAIDNHNQFKINEDLTERELFFSKLIRDADKLDIIYALSNPNIKEKLNQNNDKITKIVETKFFNEENISVKDTEHINDSLVLNLSFIYDINFIETYKIIYENKYYDKIFERIENKDIFAPYIEYINKYLNERIDK